jgi:NitT/TauT family transport system permease protein
MKRFYELRGKLPDKESKMLMVAGVGVTILTWVMIVMSGLIHPAIFPGPLTVLSTFPSLLSDDSLISNIIYSVKLNILGYLAALVLALPLGYLVGLIPIVREMFSKLVDSSRYIPLTAVTGLFIAWFGIYDFMKVSFLAFGILLYLIPCVVNRINELDQVYVDTAETLGATYWQKIYKVFIPGVLAKVSDDIRVIVAISWTYIIIAEILNKTEGIGALIATCARQSRIDKVFMLLFIIVIIGILQDKLFKLIDKWLFPYKHK